MITHLRLQSTYYTTTLANHKNSFIYTYSNHSQSTTSNLSSWTTMRSLNTSVSCESRGDSMVYTNSASDYLTFVLIWFMTHWFAASCIWDSSWIRCLPIFTSTLPIRTQSLLYILSTWSSSVSFAIAWSYDITSALGTVVASWNWNDCATLPSKYLVSSSVI